MGAGASTHDKASALHYSSTILEGKPLDASDVNTLDEAKEEITRLRRIASNALGSNENDPAVDAKGESSKTKKKKEGRAAVVARAADKDYVKKSIPKSDDARKLIYNAVKSNMLFRACSEEELVDLVDVFESTDFKAQSVVIKQGDEGEHFYVVESGTLDITVRMGEGDAQSDVQVGVPYVAGSAFGELALMYGSPRAATIQAKEDCKLWSIDRRAFKGITSQHKQRQTEKHLDFLRKVQIGDKVLGDVLKASDIDAMALATQRDVFGKGDVIVREGEKGDAFYIIESGTVDVFKKEKGDAPVATLTSGQFFGEKALLSEDVRQATCIATSEVKCLFLMREDFVLMLGDLQDLLDGKASGKDDEASGKTEESSEGEVVSLELKDLEVKRTLGIGAFGRVKLVKVKSSKEEAIVASKEGEKEKPKEGDNVKSKEESSGGGEKESGAGGSSKVRTYALKCLSKRSIMDNGLQDHVLNEKVIMSELNHPFILSFHCAMQDDRNIYFVLELLLGGELFKFLRNETQFPENWSRFYAASVLLAFCQIHSRNIAYRDLKPENLVMDADGFLKIVDFGLAKKIEGGKTWTLCGTPDYLAPEVILNEGHDWAVDYWALGVLIYEMTTGAPPFYADDPMEVYEKILSGHVNIPSNFSRGLADLVKKLLRTYQSKRLGRTKGGTGTVMKHKWFSGFDWDALLSRNLDVPIKPMVNSTEDASNFDEYPEDEGEMMKERTCPEWTPEL